jgi:hypothetical protein
MSARILLSSIAAAALALGTAPAGSAQGIDAPYDDWNPDLIGFPSNTPDSPRANCEGGGNACIDRTIGEMWRRFHRVIPRCNHNNVFSLTYLRVTEDVREAISEGLYPDLHWINHLDAMFARTKFLTYDNWRRGRRDLVPESWRIAFDAGRDQRVEGIGNLLLSMNAHVNRDFPFVLYHAGLAHPDGTSRKPEHDAYNPRLRALYRPMLTELSHRFDESIDRYDVPGTDVDDDALFQTLVMWREGAWRNAEALAAARNDAGRRQVARAIEAYAIAQAQMILAGSRYRPPEGPQARNDRCARHGGQRPGWPRGADVARPFGTARLVGNRLSVKLRCPNGIGPCRGTLKLRRPIAGQARDAVAGQRFRRIGSRRFTVPAAAEKAVGMRLRGAQARRLARRAGRGVRVAARSKLGPGDAVTRRAKLPLRAFR